MFQQHPATLRPFPLVCAGHAPSSLLRPTTPSWLPSTPLCCERGRKIRRLNKRFSKRKPPYSRSCIYTTLTSGLPL